MKNLLPPSIKEYSLPIDWVQINASDRDRLLVNKNYFDFFQEANILSFEKIWDFKGGETVKKIKERSVVKTSIPWKNTNDSVEKNGPETSCICYIKKHFSHISIWQRWLSFFSPSILQGEGIKEFNYYCSFREKGLMTVIPIVAGVRFSGGKRLESFLITKDFAPFIDLEELVLNRTDIFHGEKNKREKRNILQAIAQYARKMHDSGMNQKDFNATHILLHDLGSTQPNVALFDLQRVDNKKINRFKWPIKSLAELNFTLPENLFSEKDRFFLFKEYLSTPKPTLFNRLQWFWIKMKTAKIARHSRKRDLAPKMS